MLIVISPAKKLDYDTVPAGRKSTIPEFLGHSQILIETLRRYSALDLAELMKLSIKLAELNFDRYFDWTREIGPDNAKQCLLAFKGDVYAGMGAEMLSAEDLDYAQQHLRILSGLYGLLRPLDLMMPYRLEMGTGLPNPRGKNLYEFWGDIITSQVNKALKKQGDEILVNLASNEYFKSIKPKQIAGRIITPQFKEKRDDECKMIGVFAKKARGMMARYIIRNRISEVERIKGFAEQGYSFNGPVSDSDNWVFTRV